ncbi:MAG TPA: MoaD/ThiS family protein, partial [Myxococcota bacterium]|nr:MoaD/ThiS family protein [Myxococcota bacterium]
MRVCVPTQLRGYTAGRAEVEAAGATLGEALLDLDRRFPGIRFRVIDEQDQLRPHMRFFVNGEQVFDIAHPLVASDSVQIVQALS